MANALISCHVGVGVGVCVSWMQNVLLGRCVRSHVKRCNACRLRSFYCTNVNSTALSTEFVSCCRAHDGNRNRCTNTEITNSIIQLHPATVAIPPPVDPSTISRSVNKSVDESLNGLPFGVRVLCENSRKQNTKHINCNINIVSCSHLAHSFQFRFQNEMPAQCLQLDSN